jgi:hypothetical protein
MISCPGDGYDPFVYRLCSKKVRLLYIPRRSVRIDGLHTCTAPNPPFPSSVSTAHPPFCNKPRANGVPDRIVHFCFFLRGSRQMRSGLIHFGLTASWKSKDWRERTRSVRGICAYRKKNREGVAVQCKGKRASCVRRNSEFLQLLRPGMLAGHKSESTHSRESGRQNPVVSVGVSGSGSKRFPSIEAAQHSILFYTETVLVYAIAVTSHVIVLYEFMPFHNTP